MINYASEIAKMREGRASSPVPTGGSFRSQGFPSSIRATLIERDGKQMYEVDGYASTFSKGYEMWDMFGPYTEIMDAKAFDKSLAANPDVAFLLNHRGMTMARTANGTLDLTADILGLRAHAFLNADRQDVRDLMSGISDGLIDEMSFAFRLNDGEWNEDYDTFTITEADINRGDVSAVNYGANPFTSIGSRAAEWLAEIDRMPAHVARAGLVRLTVREAATGKGHGLPARQRPARALTDMDPDESTQALVAALDAALDSASDLVAGMDTSAMDPAVAQAFDLLVGAEAIADQLMANLGIDDPDDRGAPQAEARHGYSTDLIAKRLKVALGE